jgi:hypothetical protein
VELSVLSCETHEVSPDGTSKIDRDRINWSVRAAIHSFRQ